MTTELKFFSFDMIGRDIQVLPKDKPFYCKYGKPGKEELVLLLWDPIIEVFEIHKRNAINDNDFSHLCDSEERRQLHEIESAVFDECIQNEQILNEG